MENVNRDSSIQLRNFVSSQQWHGCPSGLVVKRSERLVFFFIFGTCPKIIMFFYSAWLGPYSRWSIAVLLKEAKLEPIIALSYIWHIHVYLDRLFNLSLAKQVEIGGARVSSEGTQLSEVETALVDELLSWEKPYLKFDLKLIQKVLKNF